MLPCYWTRLELFEVYSQQGRMAEALREARITAVEVRREGLTDYERKALLKAAEVQTSSGQVAAARALFEELMARQPDRCTAAVYMKESLAEAYVENGDAPLGRQALASAPSCDFAQDPWRVALRLRLSLLQGEREGLARSQRLADQLATEPRDTAAGGGGGEAPVCHGQPWSSRDRAQPRRSRHSCGRSRRRMRAESCRAGGPMRA